MRTFKLVVVGGTRRTLCFQRTSKREALERVALREILRSQDLLLLALLLVLFNVLLWDALGLRRDWR